MTSANIATYPARAKSLRKMLDSIHGQFDVVRICLNGYDAIPDDLKHYKCVIPETDMQDCAKFMWFNERGLDEVYFTLDDDLIYPPDYRERMEALLHDCQVVTAHGHIITELKQDWHDGHIVKAFNAAVPFMQHVHVGGTGCMAIHPNMRIDLTEWVPGQADADFALACAETQTPIMLAPHIDQWIKQQTAEGTPLSTSTRKLPRLRDLSDRLLVLWDGNMQEPPRKVCYTVITNGYDTLRQPSHITPGWEYILLTDEETRYRLDVAGSGAWATAFIEDETLQDALDLVDPKCAYSLQRIAKACPQFYNNRGSHVVRTVYVDGNITVTGDLDVLVLRTRHRYGMVTCKEHPSRNCVFDEAQAIIDLTKYDASKVNTWTEHLRNEVGRISPAGLCETNILIRDDDWTLGDSGACLTWARLMHHWGLWRDQLTFDLACDIFGAANRQPSEIFEPFIKWHPHGHEAKQTPAPEPKVTKTTVKGKAKPAAKAIEKLPSLGIIAQCPPDMLPLLPMFTMAALESNPDAHVTVFIHPNYSSPDMQRVADRHGVMRYLIAPHTLMAGAMCPPAAAHYLALPPVPRDLLFFCPITHMLLTDVRSAYLPLMEERKVGYVNDRTLYDTRLSPIHFTRYDHMHPHGLMTEPNTDLMKHPDHLLWQVVMKVNGGPLRYGEIPPTGFDVGTKEGLAAAWEAYTATEAFIHSADGLLPEAVEFLKSTEKQTA